MCFLSAIYAMFLLYGQVVENALSAFHFIFSWAANIAVLAFVSRRPILWFFHVALMNATIVVFATTQLHFETNDFLYLILFFVSATGLLMRELFASEEKGTRILIRVVGVAAVFFITSEAITAVVAGFENFGHFLAFLMFSLALVIGFGLYRRTIKDRFVFCWFGCCGCCFGGFDDLVGVAGCGGDRSRPVRTYRWCGEMVLMIW
jgi:hypothetical protein